MPLGIALGSGGGLHNAPVVDIIGGSQSAKKLLDLVWNAVDAEDLHALDDLRKEFVSKADNAERCVDVMGNTLVHLAAQKSIGTLRFVIERLACNPAKTNLHGKTPLHVAVASNNTECIRYLLQRDGNTSLISCVSHTLSTAWHTAASCGNVDSMKLLLKSALETGAIKNEADKINELDQNKCNALHKCCYDGDIRVARWLIENKIFVNQSDFQGTTPLMVAAKVGRLDMCELLLSSPDIVVNAADMEGNTALHFAAARCHASLVMLFLEKGARLNLVNKQYNTPLHLCAIHGGTAVPGWESLIVELASRAQRDVLERTNIFGKKPSDCVPRSCVGLFKDEEAARRNFLREKAREREEEDARAAAAQKTKAFVASRREIDERQRRLQEEEERLQRETEDRYRVEEDARLRREDEIEKVRAAEEEVRRKKMEKRMAKQSPGGKKGSSARGGSVAAASARSGASTTKSSPRK